MAKIVKPFGNQVTRVAGKAFKCQCGCQVLEEVRGGVAYSSVVKSVSDEEGLGMAEYGKSAADGGEVESIQYGGCGKVRRMRQVHRGRLGIAAESCQCQQRRIVRRTEEVA